MNHGQKENRNLTCILTEAERAVRGAQLAKEAQEWEATEEAKKEAASSYKKKADGHREAMKRLARIIRVNQEDREVSCTWKVAPESFSWNLIRDDTGEVVATKMMDKEEQAIYARQQPLPLGLPSAGPIVPPAPVEALQLEAKEEIPEAEFEQVAVIAPAPVVPLHLVTVTPEEGNHDEQNQ